MLTHANGAALRIRGNLYPVRLEQKGECQAKQGKPQNRQQLPRFFLYRLLYQLGSHGAPQRKEPDAEEEAPGELGCVNAGNRVVFHRYQYLTEHVLI